MSDISIVQHGASPDAPLNTGAIQSALDETAGGGW
jgi:hypothetical protein